MEKQKRSLVRVVRVKFVLPFLLVAAISAGAQDFGLLFDNTLQYGATGSGATLAGLAYTGTLTPWFNLNIRDNMEFYASLGLTAQYEYEKFSFIPELGRTEFGWRSGTGLSLAIGRQYWKDPLGFIAEGLFDGAAFTADVSGGSVGAGAWYTGLFWKDAADITMTSDELAEYNTPLDWGDFAGTYFAPKRMLASVWYEHPALAERLRFKAAALGQFDLNGRAARYDSQYFAVKFGIPVKAFIFEAGGALELIEATGEDLGVGLAGEAAATWMLPTKIADALAFRGRFSSGVSGKAVKKFTPLTTETQGRVLKAKLSGLSMLQLDYLGRLAKSFSLGAEASYFVLSDLDYAGYPGQDGHFLGLETYARAIWAPVSDIRVTAGGGAFFPQAGNAAKSADVRWLAELNMVISLY